MAATTAPVRPASRRRDAVGSLLTTGVAVLATVAIGALLPSAVASWAGGPGPGTRPVSVRLEGLLASAGPGSAPMLSPLTLHNDGPDPVRWTIDPRVEGGSTHVTVDVWVAVASTCAVRGVLLQPGRWSDSALAAGDALPLCVEVSTSAGSHGLAVGRPGLSVHARSA